MDSKFKKQKIVIIDSNYRYRHALKYLLQTIDNIEVIGDAPCSSEFLERIEKLNPDLILCSIDILVLNVKRISKVLLNKYLGIKIIVLVKTCEKKYCEQLVDLGIKNFIKKGASIEEFELAIKRILLEDTNYVSLELFEKSEPDSNLNSLEAHLTGREIEVLNLIARGHTNEEISKRLRLSKCTIGRHRANILQKTKTHNSARLIIYAVKHKLIDISNF